MTTQNNTDSNEQQGEALEPCPWCPAIPQPHPDEASNRAYAVVYHDVECFRSPQMGGYELIPRNKLAKWNSRAPTPPNELLTIPDIEKSVVPNHALIQLLESALLHPESAEGNIRQVIETLNTANDENKRLREHVADLNHDLEAAIKECDEQHGM